MVVVLVLVFVVGIFKTDEERIESARKKTVQALASRMDITQFLYDYLNGGNYGLSVKAENIRDLHVYLGGRSYPLSGEADLAADKYNCC